MRSIHFAVVALALCFVGRASCDITVDEARKIAEKHAGHSLADARVVETDLESLREVGFRDAVDAELGREYSVDLTHGSFCGWYQCSDGAAPDALPTLSDEEVLEIAKAALAEHMGPAAADVEWRLLGEDDNVVKYYCPGPLLGDPPRHGLSPSGGVEVSRRNGAIMRLSVDMPWSTTPLPVKVRTKEEAVRIAQAAAKLDWPPLRQPTLIQRGESVEWCVYLGYEGGQIKSCDIDAQTGEVLSLSSAGATYPSPEARARHDARASASTSPPASDDGVEAASAAPIASEPARSLLTAPTPSSEDPATPVSAPATTPEAPGRGRIAPIAAVAACLLVVTAGGLILLRRRR